MRDTGGGLHEWETGVRWLENEEEEEEGEEEKRRGEERGQLAHSFVRAQLVGRSSSSRARYEA